ncbi:hypothetical protein [Allorhizocola rhizosphaerae]|uniref:hypothetical protein n=1 Tax=Allorhizocola rhizosphaerae TaxID=1872709 RepID=UPI000E3EA066|nr:hypothetical protein [Allorhizocola rhizosphaerae]
MISMIFGAGTGVEAFDRLPGAHNAEDGQVICRLGDPANVDRIVKIVLGLMNEFRGRRKVASGVWGPKPRCSG